MVPDHVAHRIVVELVGVAERQVLGVIRAEHADPAVEQPQQPGVADLHAEAAVVVVGRLEQGEVVVAAVAQYVVGPQPVQRGAAHLAVADRLQAGVYRRIEYDLRVRIVGQHEVILHAVVLVHGKAGDGILGVFALVHQLGGGGDDGRGLEHAALLRIIHAAAHREGGVDFAAAQRRDHDVVAVKAYVAHVQLAQVQLLAQPGYDVPDQARRLAVGAGAAVGQIVVQVSDAQLSVLRQPLALRRGQRAAEYADRIILVPQGMEVVRLVDGKLRLRRVELCQQLRPGPADAQIVV